MSENTRWVIACVVVAGAPLVGGCGRRHVSGRIEAEDGRIGVPCTIERVETGYKGGRVVGTLAATTGENFSGELVRPAGQTLLHPTSGENDIVVRCDGYASNSRTVTVRRQWLGANLGTITVTRSRN